MFAWLRSRRDRRTLDVVAEPRDADRDSGDEERESREEAALEASPFGMTRVKTDKI